MSLAAAVATANCRKILHKRSLFRMTSGGRSQSSDRRTNLAVSTASMAATVKSPSIVEATAVKSATAMEAVSATESASAGIAVITAAVPGVAVVAPSVIATTPVSVTRTAIITASVSVARTPVVAAPVVSVIPGTNPDKRAADKVIRPVVAIRRAVIRVVRVITVGALWRRSHCGVSVSRANSHTYRHLG